MAQSSPAYSSSSFISGYFGLLDLADDMVSGLLGDIDAHVVKAERRAASQLANDAAGPWKVASQFLDVSVTRGTTSIYADGPREVVDAIESLEFGSLESAPVAFLRPEVDVLASSIQNYVNAETRKDVPLV